LNAIHRSGKTLLQLINDILDLSKIEAGKFTLQYTPVSLCALLEDIEESGKTLGSEVINLAALVATLKKAVRETEKIQAAFAENAPHPCRCGEPTCNCHNET
jgi:signal transduction histidine kinase